MWGQFLHVGFRLKKTDRVVIGLKLGFPRATAAKVATVPSRESPNKSFKKSANIVPIRGCETVSGLFRSKNNLAIVFTSEAKRSGAVPIIHKIIDPLRTIHPHGQ